MCCAVSGNLLDSDSVLTWLLNHSSGEGGLDEVSGTVMDRLVREARNLVVLFCKYAGYIAIALVHTCFLVKHYTNRPGQSGHGLFFLAQMKTEIVTAGLFFQILCHQSKSNRIAGQQGQKY